MTFLPPTTGPLSIAPAHDHITWATRNLRSRCSHATCAIGSARRFCPIIPTFKEASYDISGTGWYGVFAPAKTPSETVEKLSSALVAGVRSPHIKERVLDFGDRYHWR
jgi:tripartite-type tricarboxylate transporter receptor subunit TctC